MEQRRRHPFAHILISALMVMGLLTGCVAGPEQVMPEQQATVQPGAVSQLASAAPSETPAGSTFGTEEDIPPGTPPGAAPSPSASGDRLEVHFMDVGQADAILIKQGASAMLVDAGNNADAEFVVQYIKDQGVTKLDYVIGTHPHEDHIGGLDAVIREFQIGKIIMPKAVATTKTYEDVLVAIQQKGLKITAPVAGTEYGFGAAAFMVLAPNSASYEGLNNHSVVIRMIYGKTSFLLTGDAEAISEKEILDKGFTLKSDVLKISHHGSVTSTTAEFLDAVDPRYAVISVGEGNSYGHPSPSVIKRLQDRGIQVYRTDENGTVIAVSDGAAITFAVQSTPTPDAPVPSAPTQPAVPTKTGGVVIQSVDLVNEVVTLKNTSSEDVDLSGWELLSVKGNQSFVFPQGTIIKAGATLTIASGNAAGDIRWTNKNIWNNDGDPAQLIDARGNVVSEY